MCRMIASRPLNIKVFFWSQTCPTEANVAFEVMNMDLFGSRTDSTDAVPVPRHFVTDDLAASSTVCLEPTLFQSSPRMHDRTW